MTRYALIDQMLSNRHRPFSIQDITEELSKRLPQYGVEPVTKRCVEKDIKYLMYDSPFDIEIEEYYVDDVDRNDKPLRRRCIRYTDPTFSIFKQKLSEEEEGILTSAIETLSNFEGLDNFELLGHLKEKFGLETDHPIVIVSKNLLSNADLISRLIPLIRMNCSITLSYHTFKDANIKEVIVTPHLIKEYNNRWFLVASSCETKKILVFPLDRIDDMRENRIAPIIEFPDSMEERFEDIVGVSFNDEAIVQQIIFWVSDHSKDYVRTKPIHGSQTYLRGIKEEQWKKLFPHLRGGGFFKIECKENYELLRELTSFGPELVVLQPNTLRNKIYQNLSAMVLEYSKIMDQ